MKARALIEQYQALFHEGKARDLGAMTQWYLQSKQFLEQLAITQEQADFINLAYMVGRGERELFLRWIPAVNRAMSIREGRIREGNDDASAAEQNEAAQKAHQLKAQGVRNFVSLVATEYDKTPATVRKWMKHYPPSAR